MSRGPLAATDKRRQAGHKHFHKAGGDSEEPEGNGSAKGIAHLFSDRRKANGTSKRAD